MADANIKAEAEVVVNTSGVADAVKKATDKANAAADASSKKSRKAQTDEAAKAAKEQERIAKKRADAEARLLDKQTRDEKRGQDASQREYQRYQERLTRMHQDEVAKRAQREIDAERKSLATRKKEWQNFWKATRGLAGAAVGGALAGGAVAVNAARGLAGVQDIGSRVQTANDFRERMIVTASQAGLSTAEREQAQAQVLSTSQRTGVDASSLLGVLEQGQARFNDLKFFADNLDKIATTAKASGSDAQELAQAMGYVRQAFGLTADESKQALDLMVAAAAKGSIEVKDFARDFAPVAGLFAQATGSTGLAGARQFFGTSQAAGTLGAGSAETATMVERLVQSLGEVDVRKKLKSVGGIDIKGKSMEQIIAAMAESKRFNALGAREKIFGKGDIITGKAITSLMSAYRRTKAGTEGAIDIGSIAGVNASEGAAQTAKNFGELQASGVLSPQQEAARMQADTIANLKTYNEQIVAVAKASNDLQIKFGDAGRAVELWGSSLAATGLGSAAGGFLAGGGGGGLLSSAGKLIGGAGAGSAATMGVGALATGGAVGIGTLAAGVGAAGIAGYSLGAWIDQKTGASDWLGKLATSGVDAQRAEHARAGKQAPMVITPGEAAMIAEQRKSTQATRELAARIPARPTPPVTGNRGAR